MRKDIFLFSTISTMPTIEHRHSGRRDVERRTVFHFSTTPYREKFLFTRFWKSSGYLFGKLREVFHSDVVGRWNFHFYGGSVGKRTWKSIQRRSFFGVFSDMRTYRAVRGLGVAALRFGGFSRDASIGPPHRFVCRSDTLYTEEGLSYTYI